jgi:D-arabinose 1-dehydrogenase-like Zn-dependent alcohol dehydrogenase
MWWRAVKARRRIAGVRPASTAAAAEKTCRAVVVPRFGGPEVLEVKQGVPVPDLKPRDVLVRTRAVSINPLDLRVSAPFWTHAPPSIPLDIT